MGGFRKERNLTKKGAAWAGHRLEASNLQSCVTCWSKFLQKAASEKSVGAHSIPAGSRGLNKWNLHSTQVSEQMPTEYRRKNTSTLLGFPWIWDTVMWSRDTLLMHTVLCSFSVWNVHTYHSLAASATSEGALLVRHLHHLAPPVNIQLVHLPPPLIRCR